LVSDIQRPPKELVEALRELASPTVHEAQGRRGAMDPAIKSVKTGSIVCGPAFTVKCPLGDNLTLLTALDLAQEGDVLVANMSGGVELFGGWGEITTTMAMTRKLGGLVIDSGVRDVAIIKELGFPVFSRGVCIKGTIKENFGDINRPISCAGVVVNPGDLILGDDDGVVVVRFHELAAVIERSRQRMDKEEAAIAAVKRGESLIDMMGWRPKVESFLGQKK